MALADRTHSRPLRHNLLRVLQAALSPSAASAGTSAVAASAPGSAAGPAAAAQGRAAAVVVTTANCAAFVAAGGVQFAADLLASEPWSYFPSDTTSGLRRHELPTKTRLWEKHTPRAFTGLTLRHEVAWTSMLLLAGTLHCMKAGNRL